MFLDMMISTMGSGDCIVLSAMAPIFEHFDDPTSSMAPSQDANLASSFAKSAANRDNTMTIEGQ